MANQAERGQDQVLAVIGRHDWSVWGYLLCHHLSVCTHRAALYTTITTTVARPATTDMMHNAAREIGNWIILWRDLYYYCDCLLSTINIVLMIVDCYDTPAGLIVKYILQITESK